MTSSCATQQVEDKLATKLSSQGRSYSREIKAQSPFKKVELSWNEASELMKVRNLKYRKSIIDKEQAQEEKGLVKSFTSELRKNLTDTVQTTFSPTEIASLLKSPIASVPRQFDSITNLKNVSHSMTSQEWDRVSLAMTAETSSREEKVKLHQLFREHQLLNERAEVIEKYQTALKAEDLPAEKAPLDKVIVENAAKYQQRRQDWLNKVRDFFDAEYFDVEFKNYNRTMPLYRETTNPHFDDHKRWMTLDHSIDLVSELSEDHKEMTPELPVVGMLKSSLGASELVSNSTQLDLIVNQAKTQESMRKDVRRMIKNWRELKKVQRKLAAAEADLNKVDKISPAELNLTDQIYQLKMQELSYVSQFWVKDETCWKK